MESNDQNPCFHCANSLHLHISVVCWWAYRFPFISHQYKSGKIPHFLSPLLIVDILTHCVAVIPFVLFFFLHRLLMRISDIDMIGEPTPITKEWCRTSRRYFAPVSLHQRTISGQRCQGNQGYRLGQGVQVLLVQTWEKLWRTLKWGGKQFGEMWGQAWIIVKGNLAAVMV